jgi:hypothetical protein
MRRRPRFGAIAAALAVAVAVWAAQAPASLRSGVRGRVLFGPTCPVERVGQSCTRPYQAWLAIRREPRRSLVTRVLSSTDGYFSVGLAPGRYLLVPQAGHPFPIGLPQTFTVAAGRYTRVTVHLDSGIR